MRELLLLLSAIAVHECGHILTAVILGVPILSVKPTVRGAVISFDYSGKGYLTEAVVHMSGPLLGLIFGVIVRSICSASARFFFGSSVTLSVVNLLPITGSDGEGIVKCLLSYYLMPDTVWRVCRVLSFISIVLLWTAVLWIELRTGGSLSLMVFVLFTMLGMMK